MGEVKESMGVFLYVLELFNLYQKFCRKSWEETFKDIAMQLWTRTIYREEHYVLDS